MCISNDELRLIPTQPVATTRNGVAGHSLKHGDWPRGFTKQVTYVFTQARMETKKKDRPKSYARVEFPISAEGHCFRRQSTKIFGVPVQEPLARGHCRVSLSTLKQKHSPN